MRCLSSSMGDKEKRLGWRRYHPSPAQKKQQSCILNPAAAAQTCREVFQALQGRGSKWSVAKSNVSAHKSNVSIHIGLKHDRVLLSLSAGESGDPGFVGIESALTPAEAREVAGAIAHGADAAEAVGEIQPVPLAL